jgi:hypothetical protein
VDESPRRTTASSLHFEVDAAGIAAFGSSGFGYEVAARLRGASWSARAGTGARFGSLPAADATTSTARIFVGGGVEVVRAEPFAITLGVDAVALRQDVHHRVPGGDRVERARWIAGFDVLADASFGLSSSVALFVATGAELGLGETSVIIGDREVATIPRVRSLTFAGMRLRF